MSFYGAASKACLLFALVYPVLVSGQKVKVDYDKSVDFAKFRTYSWGELAPPTHATVTFEYRRDYRPATHREGAPENGAWC